MADEVEIKEQEKLAEAANSGWQLVNFDALNNPPAWLVAPLYALAALVGFAVIVLVAFGLYATFPIAYETAFGGSKDRIEAAKVFFPILLALVGGPLLIWRVVTAHVQATAARHQANVAQEGLYTSLFTKAVEQLGATREVKTYQKIKNTKIREAVTTTEPNLEVRLGAIYALDRVARDSERDHWPIMQVLCAYIRNPQNSGVPTLRPEGAAAESKEFKTWWESLKPPRVDVQAALTVIGQRLERSRQLEAKRNLRLDLRKANLQQAVLDASHFERGIFDNAYLDGASFSVARLDGASFNKAHLAHGWFSEAYFDNAQFVEADLANAWFLGTHLNRARFSKAQLVGAWFDEAHLSGAQFGEAQLTGAWFGGTNLDSSRFNGADLSAAWFNDAQLSNVLFEDARLVGTKFYDVDLSRARALDSAELTRALGDASTKLPDGMERPSAWPDQVLSNDERRDWINKIRDQPPEKA